MPGSESDTYSNPAATAISAAAANASLSSAAPLARVLSMGLPVEMRSPSDRAILPAFTRPTVVGERPTLWQGIEQCRFGDGGRRHAASRFGADQRADANAEQAYSPLERNPFEAQSRGAAE